MRKRALVVMKMKTLMKKKKLTRKREKEIKKREKLMQQIMMTKYLKMRGRAVNVLRAQKGIK